ncbi:acyltransferase family protein [Microbacterium sp. 4R-513]|uniref:acyltransferase family protein n=1 Tax=Microbacterium sp. 4R-513 TaxID=2567934 RepID=UPI0013E139B0|nr:acyltransferase family protein [Microbacterium sp. 4R-513]QIG38557.1 acyltransferase family protein [Microbacterium sp. 4R-513]
MSTAAIPAPSRRDVTLDILRVIGIAAVVVAHVWWMTDWAHAYIFSWNMPLFFFLTGYLWKTRPFASMVRRRSEMLLIPYAFWLVVWSIIVVVVTGQYTVRFVVGQVIGGRYMADKPFWAFWFSTALFVLVLAYWAVSKLPLWAQWLVAAALLVPAYVAPELVRMVPFAAATGLACMVFLLAGRTVRRFEGAVPLVWRVVGGAVIAIASFVLFGLGLVQPVDLKVVEFGTPVVSVVLAIAIVTGGMWVLRGVVTALRLHSAPTLSLLAESTFMVTLTHAGILWAIDPLELPQIAQFVIALAVPWAAALVVRHTRASRLLTGMPQRPARVAAAMPVGV